MKLKLYTAPVIEPITLSELGDHLKLDHDTFAESLTSSVCIPAGSHGVTVGYTLYGSGADVLGKKAIVFLRPVDNGAGATVDVKIQESEDNTNWTDWGAFTQVTEANDTVVQEKEYTGSKRYIRTAAKTLILACSYGTDILVQSATAVETDKLTSILKAAREHVEGMTSRALLTQTWEYYLDQWPQGDTIKLPFGNLQSIAEFSYKKSGWASAADDVDMVAGTDYILEQNGAGVGRLVLPYGGSWPSDILYPANPIMIRFVAGWLTAAAVPYKIKAAMKLIAADLYFNVEGQIVVAPAQAYSENKTVQNLLASERLYEMF